MLELHDRLLAWYEACRRDLPWRKTRDPYAIWVSEIMLQQTRVETVRPYYARFLSRFPTVHSLAEADTDEVLAAWSGLGYYRRARMLHDGARAVAAAGTMPGSRAKLLDVPGVGPYTAGAIASIAYGEAVGLVDGNVARVLARLFAIHDDMRRGPGMKKMQVLADRIVASENPSAWNQSLMELGATVCTPRSPSCAACPVSSICRAHAQGIASELPVLSAKTAPIPARVQALVATMKDQILLARRHRDRLFGGLWEPPTIDGSSKLRAELTAPFALGPVTRVGKVVHTLSHRKLTVDVLTARLVKKPTKIPVGYDAIRLVSPNALGTLGISTLARKILGIAGVL